MRESQENYLESILILSEKNEQLRAIDIVNHLEFSKPSVSVALKKLKEAGFINVDINGYITLTPQGETQAKDVYEKHTVLTKALMTLGVEEKTAKDDACRIEHIISEASFSAIKKHMGM